MHYQGWGVLLLALVALVGQPALAVSHKASSQEKLDLGQRMLYTVQSQYGQQQPRFFKQYIDHWDSASNTTFNQRYYMNDTYWSSESKVAGKPVFLLLGGQAPLRGSSEKIKRVMELAKGYGALVFALEHRYYGQSYPTDLSTENLRLLSVEQAVEDVARFISVKSTDMALNVNTTNPWVLFGSSLAGSLAAWTRLKYPHLVHSAYAASAPLKAQLEFHEYDQAVRKRAGTACAKSIEEATLGLEKETAKVSSKVLVKEQFGCEMLASNKDFFYAIAEIISYGIMNPSYGGNVNGKSTNRGMDFCKRIVNATSVEEKITEYSAFVKDILKESQKSCGDFDISSYSDVAPDESKMARQVAWQSCSQLGWFQTAPPSNGIRSGQVDLDWHLEVCEDLFGEGISPQVDQINTLYGGKQYSGSNVVFTNGLGDPWATLGLTVPIVFNYVVTTNDSAHAADLLQPVHNLPSPILASMRVGGENALNETLTEVKVEADTGFKGASLKLLVIISICCGIGCLVLSLVIALLFFKPREVDPTYEGDGQYASGSTESDFYGTTYSSQGAAGGYDQQGSYGGYQAPQQVQQGPGGYQGQGASYR